MAYSDLERPRYYNAKYTQFYPEEHDYIPGHGSEQVNYNHPHHTRNGKDPYNANKQDYTNECDFKTPIYVHPTRKADNFSTKNWCYTDILNYHSINGNKERMNRKQKKVRKSTQKTVINKLEETYWSNWKPSKDKSQVENWEKDLLNDEDKLRSGHPVKNKIMKTVKSKKGRGDNSEGVVEHFTSKYFDYHNTSSETLSKKKSQKYHNSIEIQTDLSSITLTKMEETKEPATNDPDIIKEIIVELEEQEEKLMSKYKIEQDRLPNIEEDNPESSQVADMKPVSAITIKHTDSLVILKKKQGEQKERVEQPKCIKLFRKLKAGGLPFTRSYMRGGSYPLKSCMKPEYSMASRFSKPVTNVLISSTKTKSKKK